MANYLGAEAEGEAGESGAGEEGQPVLHPAPGRVEAPVHEHQRRPLAPAWDRDLCQRVLRDDLEVEAGRQAVEAAGLALLVRVGARGAEGPPPPRCRRRPRCRWRRDGEDGKGERGGGGGLGAAHLRAGGATRGVRAGKLGRWHGELGKGRTGGGGDVTSWEGRTRGATVDLGPQAAGNWYLYFLLILDV